MTRIVKPLNLISNVSIQSSQLNKILRQIIYFHIFHYITVMGGWCEALKYIYAKYALNLQESVLFL